MSNAGALRLAEEYIIQYYKASRGAVDFGEFRDVCQKLQKWCLSDCEAGERQNPSGYKDVDNLPSQFGHDGWRDESAGAMMIAAVGALVDCVIGRDTINEVASEIFRVAVLEFEERR